MWYYFKLTTMHKTCSRVSSHNASKKTIFLTPNMRSVHSQSLAWKKSLQQSQTQSCTAVWASMRIL